MPDLRPYLGWGFAGLHRKLKEKLDDIEAQIAGIETEIEGIEIGEVSATTLKFTSTLYNGGTETNVKAAFDEIAGTGRTGDHTVKSAYDLANGKYALPAEGIPYANLDVAVQASLDLADSAYQLESGGIPADELAGDIPADKLHTDVQSALTSAGTALQPGDPVSVGDGDKVNAKSATAKLTVSGTAKDGETVSIGDEVYELDVDGSIGAGHIQVNISGGTKTQATAKLSVSGAVPEGDTFTVGNDTFEADYDGVVESGNIRLDLSGAGGAALAEGVFTLTNDVADGQTVTIGAYTFEFDTNNTIAPGHIKVNVAGNLNPQAACIALAAAIETALNGLWDAQAGYDSPNFGVTVTARIKGTHMNWAVSDTCTHGSWSPSPALTSGGDATNAEAATIIETRYNAAATHAITAAVESGTNVDFTANIAGVLDGSAGNAIELGDTNFAGTFDFATLVGGTDCTEAEAAAAIIAAIEGNTDSVVNAATDGNDNVDVTVKLKGVAGNELTVAETMGNGSWGAVSGGVNGDVGSKGDLYFGSNYLYLAIADNTINDANWRRADFGSVY